MKLLALTLSTLICLGSSANAFFEVQRGSYRILSPHALVKQLAVTQYKFKHTENRNQNWGKTARTELLDRLQHDDRRDLGIDSYLSELEDSIADFAHQVRALREPLVTIDPIVWNKALDRTRIDAANYGQMFLRITQVPELKDETLSRRQKRIHAKFVRAIRLLSVMEPRPAGDSQ